MLTPHSVLGITVRKAIASSIFEIEFNGNCYTMKLVSAVPLPPE